MPIPVRQNVRVGTHLLRQRLSRRKYYPFIVEIEPLFACNLSCPGCGKIQHPTDILRKRLSVEDVVGAVEESGTPMVSIAGGEPLLHPDIDRMVAALVDRKVYVYLCTNAVLLRRRLDRFTPSRYFSWVVHVDGLRERHDAAVDREGVFDEAVAAIRDAKASGLPGDDELDVLQHRLAQDRAGRARLPQRRPRGRRHDDLAGLRLREGAGPGALPRRRADPATVPGRLRRRTPQALAPQPLAAVPRLPRGQGATSPAPPGASRATRSSGGSVPAT